MDCRGRGERVVGVERGVGGVAEGKEGEDGRVVRAEGRR